MDETTTAEYIYELNVCEPVQSAYSSCSVANSPFNQIEAHNTNVCVNLGDTDVWSMDLTPYKDGLMLQYFHGYYVNNIQPASTTYYIICNASEAMSFPYVEHVRSCLQQPGPDNAGYRLGMQYHVKIFTKYACPSN